MRRRREREIPAYAGFVRRSIRSHGRRVGDADPEDLAGLLELREVVEEAIADAVRGQRANGFSWSQIARGLGTTRQAAQQRYGIRPVLHPAGRPDDYDGDLLAVCGR
jgi:hypothetical protein